MLCVLAIAGGLLLAWMLGSWLERRHFQYLMEQFGQRTVAQAEAEGVEVER